MLYTLQKSNEQLVLTGMQGGGCRGDRRALTQMGTAPREKAHENFADRRMEHTKDTESNGMDLSEQKQTGATLRARQEGGRRANKEASDRRFVTSSRG